MAGTPSHARRSALDILCPHCFRNPKLASLRSQIWYTRSRALRATNVGVQSSAPKSNTDITHARNTRTFVPINNCLRLQTDELRAQIAFRALWILSNTALSPFVFLSTVTPRYSNSLQKLYFIKSVKLLNCNRRLHARLRCERFCFFHPQRNAP